MGPPNLPPPLTSPPLILSLAPLQVLMLIPTRELALQTSAIVKEVGKVRMFQNLSQYARYLTFLSLHRIGTAHGPRVHGDHRRNLPQGRHHAPLQPCSHHRCDPRAYFGPRKQGRRQAWEHQDHYHGRGGQAPLSRVSARPRTTHRYVPSDTPDLHVLRHLPCHCQELLPEVRAEPIQHQPYGRAHAQGNQPVLRLRAGEAKGALVSWGGVRSKATTSDAYVGLDDLNATRLSERYDIRSAFRRHAQRSNASAPNGHYNLNTLRISPNPLILTHHSSSNTHHPILINCNLLRSSTASTPSSPSLKSTSP